jgi:hypothetical protein
LKPSPGSGWISRERAALHIAGALWITDRARPLLRAARVDYPRFRALLENRLRLEAHGASKLGAAAGLLAGAAMMSVFGLGFGVIALSTREPLYWLAGGQAAWLFFMTMLLLNMSGDLLLDTTDIAVVAHLPVSDRTILAARLAHALVTLGMLGTAFAFFPTLCGCFVFPPLKVIAIFPLATMLTAFTGLGAVALLHASVLRAFGATHFQRASLVVQIATVTLLMSISQILPRLPWGSAVELLHKHRAFGLLLPPMHFDGLWSVAGGSTAPVDLLLCASAFALPLLLTVIALRLVARRFVAALSDPVIAAAKSAPAWQQSTLARLGAWTTTSRQAHASYGVALALSRREKTFLRGVWPQVGMFAAMGCGIAFGPGRRGHGGLPLSYAPFALYWLSMIALGVFDLGRFSEHASARWIFDALPSERAASLIEGGYKALLCGTVLPVLFVAAVVTTAVAGSGQVLDGVIALEATTLLSLCAASFYAREIPFTQQVRPGARLDRLGVMLLIMFAAAAMAGVHALARLHWIAEVALIAVYAGLLVWRWRALAHATSPARKRAARLENFEPPG